MNILEAYLIPPQGFMVSFTENDEERWSWIFVLLELKSRKILVAINKRWTLKDSIFEFCRNLSIIELVDSSSVIPSFSSSLRRQVWSAAVTISRLNRLLITLDRHVRTHTWDNIAQKYSMEKINIYFSLPGIDLGHLSIQV